MKLVTDSKFKTDLTLALLTSPIVYIQTYHYSYVNQVLQEILFPVETAHHLFSDVQIDQVCEYDFAEETEIEFYKNGGACSTCMLQDVLCQIANGIGDDKIFLLKGIAQKIIDNAEIQHYLSRIASMYEVCPLESKVQTIIIVDNKPITQLPTSIMSFVQTLRVPLPDEMTIEKIVDQLAISKSVKEPSLLKRKIVHSLKGLDLYQIEMIINKILIKTGGFLTKMFLKYVQEEKMQIVKKTEILDVVISNINLDMIGGLDVLREDIKNKSCIFEHLDFSQSSSARVTLPKGILILGMPGCGKSMFAKGIASEFALPLLRLDVGRLMGSYVGESEENLRNALAIVEATSPCVLWVDEVEKAFAGTQGRGQEDNLVVRMMGTFLTWMQERISPIYIVATANDVMRPEFMRKGRFDEVYFVDFPNEYESEQILRKKIEYYTRDIKGVPSIYNFNAVLSKNNMKIIIEMMKIKKNNDFVFGFSGAEIEYLVNSVVEKKYREYLKIFGAQNDHKINVTIEDFKCEIEGMLLSRMSNQNGKDNDGSLTNIARIRELQRIYQFKNASK